MSLFGFNQYDALPGHKVSFKDGNLNLKNDPTAEATESIVFLGTATDGPINQPIRVTPENAYQIFGKITHENGVPNGATLLPAFEEAWQAGNRDIRLMRVTGKTAVASLVGESYQEQKTINHKVEFIGHGNEELDITLHGGLIPDTLVIRANGMTLPVDKYEIITTGTPQKVEYDFDNDTELSVIDPEVYAVVKIKRDAVDMESDISVSYQYTVIRQDTDDPSSEDSITNSVAESNVDVAGYPLIARGYAKTYTLDHIPQNVHVYVGDREVLEANAFKVETKDVSGTLKAQITFNPSSVYNLNEGIEVVYSYVQLEEMNPVIKLESIYGGSLYNETTVSVEKDGDIVTVTITKPDSKKAIMSEPPLIFKSTYFPTFQLLVNAINTHPNNNVVRASVSNQFANQPTNTLQEKPVTYFSGGSDELNLSKEEMYKRLGGVKDSEGYVVEQGAYHYLENYNVDYVVPLGVYADDKLVGKYDNFAYQLALACAVMSHYNRVTIGLINTTSPATTTLKDIEDHVKKLEELPNEFYMRDRFGVIIQDGEGERIDLGQFIQIIAGPDLVVNNTRLGLVASNTPATYAGFISRLPVESAPTNKAMPSVSNLRFEYSSAQLNRLTKARYVTYKRKPNGQIGIVDAMTAAHSGSDYTRLSTVRAVKEAINQIREVADPFIGEPPDTANQNALAAAIEKRLSKMVEKRALMDYDFHIVVTPQMELMGEGQIELTLRAPRELRNLTTIVSLS